MSVLLTGVGNGATALSAGNYWRDGDGHLLAPTAANFTSTTRFSDGSAGDQTTREDSTGGVISILYVHTGPLQIALWAFTMRYGTSTLSPSLYYWNGSAFATLTDLNETLWGGHIGTEFESRTSSFDGNVTATIFLAVMTAGNVGCSDSRPS